MNIESFIDAVAGRIIVSCQAGHGHPLRESGTIARMAQAAELGGAAAIRCGGVGGIADVAAVAATVGVPVIGLTKTSDPGVFITPTVDAARALVSAGAHVVAADATDRPRPRHTSFRDIVSATHDAGALVMADVSTVSEGIEAAGCGADLIATTLAGYTGQRREADGPDLELVRALSDALPGVPIVAEGRYHYPNDAVLAIKNGATSVVVGTAITDPVWITRSFTEALEQAGLTTPPSSTDRPHASSPEEIE